ncbi:uncharacterized protein MEPE_04567 [Melanopsichium pennsylvanicum]|uniref:Uncharacterized protein n=1 Tax=Melanopsichium pennsylvanicum TaxID=63383 RepID=A0AAJ5C6U0_9BASI|nr:uncharacterized protein MEPE_04567 [Melanopsichium pennsylvanicum]
MPGEAAGTSECSQVREIVATTSLSKPSQGLFQHAEKLLLIALTYMKDLVGQNYGHSTLYPPPCKGGWTVSKPYGYELYIDSGCLTQPFFDSCTSKAIR